MRSTGHVCSACACQPHRRRLRTTGRRRAWSEAGAQRRNRRIVAAAAAAAAAAAVAPCRARCRAKHHSDFRWCEWPHARRGGRPPRRRPHGCALVRPTAWPAGLPRHGSPTAALPHRALGRPTAARCCHRRGRPQTRPRCPPEVPGCLTMRLARARAPRLHRPGPAAPPAARPAAARPAGRPRAHRARTRAARRRRWMTR